MPEADVGAALASGMRCGDHEHVMLGECAHGRWPARRIEQLANERTYTAERHDVASRLSARRQRAAFRRPPTLPCPARSFAHPRRGARAAPRRRRGPFPTARRRPQTPRQFFAMLENSTSAEGRYGASMRLVLIGEAAVGIDDEVRVASGEIHESGQRLQPFRRNANGERALAVEPLRHRVDEFRVHVLHDEHGRRKGGREIAQNVCDRGRAPGGGADGDERRRWRAIGVRHRARDRRVASRRAGR